MKLIMTQVEKGHHLKVHYVGRLDDGEIFDSTEDRDPYEFTVGSGIVLDGFEEAFLGMLEQESKTIHIPCAEAYGPYYEELVEELPMSALPEGYAIQIGEEVVSRKPDGSEIPVVVKEVNKTSFIVDGNHELAGKDLTFEIKLLEIEE